MGENYRKNKDRFELFTNRNRHIKITKNVGLHKQQYQTLFTMD